MSRSLSAQGVAIVHAIAITIAIALLSSPGSLELISLEQFQSLLPILGQSGQLRK